MGEGFKVRPKIIQGVSRDKNNSLVESKPGREPVLVCGVSEDVVSNCGAKWETRPLLVEDYCSIGNGIVAGIH